MAVRLDFLVLFLRSSQILNFLEFKFYVYLLELFEVPQVELAPVHVAPDQRDCQHAAHDHAAPVAERIHCVHRCKH